MSNPVNNQPRLQFNQPLISFFVLLILAFLGANTLGQFFGYVLAYPFIEGDFLDFLQDLMGSPSNKVPIFILQGAYSITGFIIIPYLYLTRLQKQSVASFNWKHPSHNKLAIITVLATISFMAVNPFFVEWNAELQFPEFLGEIEDFARRLEKTAADITNFLTEFDNFGQFAIALLVIAIIPAIGEEFLFRGILQNMALDFTKNPHLAVWITAIFFSAIHMQLFGFVPRVLLGALFGYIYLWSGSLRLAMLSHFINNGVMLTLVYLYGLNITDYNIEDTESVPIVSVLIFAFITGMLLFLFKKLSTATSVNE